MSPPARRKSTEIETQTPRRRAHCAVDAFVTEGLCHETVDKERKEKTRSRTNNLTQAEHTHLSRRT